MKTMKGIEVSVVLPCLNEEATIGECIRKIRKVFREQKLSGEIIVSDNNSTDNSVEIAESLGAKVVHQEKKGYGNTYLKGLSAARGRYIVIADSDNTYDFLEMPKFLAPLKSGEADFVIGSRLKGTILPGAMPMLHQYAGNPLFTSLMNLFFHVGISDAYCGMRAFNSSVYNRLALVAGGMEFGLEMVAKAALLKLKIKEVPITYHPRDGAPSKLRSFYDGWRSLRFMLMYSPDYLFLLPGGVFFLVGLFLMFLLLPGPVYFPGWGLDVHTMLLGSLMSILGFQVLVMGLTLKTYAVAGKFQIYDRMTAFVSKHFSLERALLVGSVVATAGLIVGLNVLYGWYLSGFGKLSTLRQVIVASNLIIIGLQTIFSAFLMSILLIEKRNGN